MLNPLRAACLLATLVFSTQAPQAALPEAAPEFAWAVSAGGKGHDKTRCLAVDARGNVFLAGEFVGTSQFGEHTLTSAGDMDFFIVKCPPDGKFLWVRSAGGSGIDRGYGVATDAAGSCYVTGHFQSTNATFSGSLCRTPATTTSSSRSMMPTASCCGSAPLVAKATTTLTASRWMREEMPS